MRRSFVNRKNRSGAGKKKKKNGLFSRKETRVLTLGLDASGKTTILYRMKLGEVVTTIPTIGFNVETVSVGREELTVWDVGGQPKIRPLWRHYYQNSNVVMFVVDSNDRDRLDDAKDELHKLLGEDELDDASLLVVANKQDLPYAKTPAEIEAHLELEERCKGKRHYACVPHSISDDPQKLAQILSAVARGVAIDHATISVVAPVKKEEEPRTEDEIDEIYRLRDEAAEKIEVEKNVFVAGTEYCLKLAGAEHQSTEFTAAQPIHGGERSLPFEIVNLIMGYLPISELLPTAVFTYTGEAGLWLTSRAFLVASMDEAVGRFVGMLPGEELPGIDCGDDVKSALEHSFRAAYFLSVPPEMVPLHLNLCASMLSVAVYGTDISLMEHLHLTDPRSTWNPGKSPYNNVRRVAFAAAHRLHGVSDFSLVIEQNDVLKQYVDHLGSKMRTMEDMFRTSLFDHLKMFTTDLVHALDIITANEEVFRPADPEEEENDDDEGNGDDAEVEGAPPLIKCVEIGSKTILSGSLEPLQRTLKRGRFAGLLLDHESKDGLSFPKDVLQAVFDVLRGKCEEKTCRQIAFSFPAGDPIFSVIRKLLAHTASFVDAVEVDVSGSVSNDWVNPCEDGPQIPEDDPIRERFPVIMKKGNTTTFFSSTEAADRLS